MTSSMPVQVAREIGRRIIAGTIPAGILLDEENTLATKYQVSRVVVRDAVKILVGKGLLDVRRGIGTRVKPRDQWSMLDDDVLAWHLSTPPNIEFLKQLMEIRVAFEPKAASWAAKRATKEDIAEISAAIEGMENEDGSIENFVIADAVFHRSVLRAAHNEFLKGMEGVIYSALLVSIRLTNKDPRDNHKSVPFHREVYDAIVAGDADKAEKLTETLLSDAQEKIEGMTANYL